jgi:hypothetical protein
VNTSLPHVNSVSRARVLAARIVFVAFWAIAALCFAGVFDVPAVRGADGAALPLALPSSRPHAVGDVFNYSLHGTLSQSIVGHDPFGRQVRQVATPTVLQGRERIAVKAISAQGLALHRSGSVVATFNGKSSSTQSGTGWTLVTPLGNVEDRKGSTLGGLFLLPLGFLADRAVNGGATPNVGDRWNAKLGMTLFGMAAQPRLSFSVVGTRRVFGMTVLNLVATGSAPVKEPVVTNDGIALGNAVGTAHVTLRCDYDPASLRAVSMDIVVWADLRLATSRHGASGKVSDRQRYLVALDADSLKGGMPAANPAQGAKATPPGSI